MENDLNQPDLEFIQNIFEDYGETIKFSIGQLVCTEK